MTKKLLLRYIQWSPLRVCQKVYNLFKTSKLHTSPKCFSHLQQLKTQLIVEKKHCLLTVWPRGLLTFFVTETLHRFSSQRKDKEMSLHCTLTTHTHPHAHPPAHPPTHTHKTLTYFQQHGSTAHALQIPKCKDPFIGRVSARKSS